jgi:outer membrane protein TolC
MIIKKGSAIFLVLTATTLIFTGCGNTQEFAANGDILQQIVDLVVENNPTLQSQRRLLNQIQALPDPGKGIDIQLSVRGGLTTYADEDDQAIWFGPTGGVGLEIPLFSSSRRRERIMDQITYAKEVEEATQHYFDLKNFIVSELLRKLRQVSGLQNEKRKLEELKSFLSSNVESLKQQVKTGVIKATDLWELTERIMDTEASIYHQSTELNVLRREIAINFGGEKTRQLRQMLEQLSVKYTEEEYLESR